MSGWNCCSVRVWHIWQLSPFSHWKFCHADVIMMMKSKSKTYLLRVLPIFANLLHSGAGGWTVLELFRISASIFSIVIVWTGVALTAKPRLLFTRLSFVVVQDELGIIPLENTWYHDDVMKVTLSSDVFGKRSIISTSPDPPTLASKIGALRSSWPWPNAQWGPFFSQLRLSSVSWIQAEVFKMLFSALKCKKKPCSISGDSVARCRR